MPDTATLTWTDTTGTYTSTISIENPTLADVKEAYNATAMATRAGPLTDAAPITDQDFYDALSLRFVMEAMNYAQSHKHQQATAAVPPIVVTPVETPPATRRD